MRTQLSAEFLIIMTMIVSIALFLLASVSSQASLFSSKLNSSADKLLDKIDLIVNSSR